jgi:hypothetical protein
VTIARSVDINAPEAIVFPYLNNLRRFNEWSPWATRDPELKVSFSGPEEGQGARIDWASQKKNVGEGSIEITQSSPSRRVEMDVNFHELPGKSYYDVAPSGSGSRVTWGFNYDTGPNPLNRWTGLMRLDRLVGAEFRDGLVKLEDRIESERRPTMPGDAGAAPMSPQGGAVTVAPGAAVEAPVSPPATQPPAPPAPAPQP